MTPDEFFGDQDEARRLFEALSARVAALGPAEMRVTKSQIAFWRRKAFAWAWMPGQYLRGRRRRQLAPLVLTVGLNRRDPSPRWKEVVEPARGRFVHHLELYAAEELDAEVDAWLGEAYALAAE